MIGARSLLLTPCVLAPRPFRPLPLGPSPAPLRPRLRRPAATLEQHADRFLRFDPAYSDSAPAWVATILFAGNELVRKLTQWKPQVTIDDVYILLTWSLVAHAIHIIMKRDNAETETAVVGAAYLAVKYVGNIGSSIGPLQVVTALFGVYQSLEMPGPAIAWILSLLASMRAGWGLEWFVLSYAASAAWKGTRAILAGDVPVGALAFLATAAYAYHQRLLTKLAMCIFVGRIFATAVPRS